MRTALLNKIDESARQITARLQATELLIAAHTTRLDAVDQAQADLTTQLAALKLDMTNRTAAPHTPSAMAAVISTASSVSSPLAMDDVIREIDLRSSKKSNIVLSGVKPSLLTDAEVVTKLLADELHITTSVIHCTRLGKPNPHASKPRLLLATLVNEKDAHTVLRSAKDLRGSSDPYVSAHVYLNADLTREQRLQEYNLRTELKQRRLAGESDLIIRNGKVIAKPLARVAARTGASVSLAP
jgi:hypothetical protein